MTPQELLAGRFERFQVGLSARFRACPRWLLTLALSRRAIALRRILRRDYGAVSLDHHRGTGRPFMHSIDLGESDQGFHQQLASLFLDVAEKQSFDELWPNQECQQSI